jgi:hypothetical protein
LQVIYYYIPEIINWISHIRVRNCHLKHVTEEKIEGRIEDTGRRGRRRQDLMDEVKEIRRYWKLKDKALDRTLPRARFGIVYGTCHKTGFVKNE